MAIEEKYTLAAFEMLHISEVTSFAIILSTLHESH